MEKLRTTLHTTLHRGERKDGANKSRKGVKRKKKNSELNDRCFNCRMHFQSVEPSIITIQHRMYRLVRNQRTAYISTTALFPVIDIVTELVPSSQNEAQSEAATAPRI